MILSSFWGVIFARKTKKLLKGSQTLVNNLLSPFSAMQFLHGGLFFMVFFH